MNTYHIEVKLCTGTDWCTALKPIEITAEHKEDVYKKILDGFNALEKQIPKKPEYEADGYADCELVYDYAKCPICGHDFEYGINDWESDYCSDCGQKLDWSN